MDPAKSHFLRPSEAGTVCRVIRQGAIYLCGMCRAPYDSFSHAMSCVQDCWEELLRWDPVIPRRHGRDSVLYRCRFCARDYATRELAAHCATDCRERFKVRFALEMEAWGQVEDLTSKPLHKNLPRRSLHLVPMPMGRKKARKDEGTKDSSKDQSAHGAEASHDTKEDAHVESPSLKAPAKEVATATSASKEKKPPAEPFSRNGAQYVCNGCQKKYFTKDEVVSCFASHGSG